MAKYGGLGREVFFNLVEKQAPFIKNFFNPSIVEVSKTSLLMKLNFNANFVGNPAYPCLHGGVCAAMIDHVGGMSVWATLDSVFERVSTVDLRIDYLHPAPCEDLYFEGIIIHKSKKLCRSDIVCWNSDKTKKIAIGRGLFNIYNVPVDISEALKA
jgi:acyl-coenzyme A thioesterase PaaI-like protein